MGIVWKIGFSIYKFENIQINQVFITPFTSLRYLFNGIFYSAYSINSFCKMTNRYANEKLKCIIYRS